ncbi:asparaginyl-tRNA synthetase [Geoalkalibacter ferrihydriticus DSM 17813]|uniref:Asparagine--tRNA ligase n=2 Tax=Geoalkalibacter ferrihydriticus TaxID=392333 RepID=A0A0C2HZW0_9BACT|nr:asparaginyl-tRNA synthetase [Geoalkalibacter ferrihydriticus DSM 17813]
MTQGRTRINRALSGEVPPGPLLVKGWVRTVRRTKNLTFVALNDGSCLESLQIVVDTDLPGYAESTNLGTGACVEARGELVASPAAGQPWELHAHELRVLGAADADYPLQKKRHGFEYLRSIAHLRLRSNTFGAVFRVRSALSFAIHRFFQERGFLYVQTPIITANDCEGAGEMFRVSTLDPIDPPRLDGAVDWTRDFFGERTGLTVSGQLQGEAFACAFSDIYTFGPTFRAENSNTSRHAAEFWMIEPEMAFADLAADCRLAADFIQYLCRYALDNCSEDLKFFDNFVEKGLIEKLGSLADAEFQQLTYTDAIKELQASGRTFEFSPVWGSDLQSEHERFLSEQVVKGPLFVTDYPKDIKAFYMRLNDDGKTVAAMDCLVPRVGEIIGGSQREERLDVLAQRMREAGIAPESLGWFLDLRRWGTCPHAGFGLGFERLLMYVTGMTNIRDVIPFPRTPGNARF